jgi:hypothetical protein
VEAAVSRRFATLALVAVALFASSMAVAGCGSEDVDKARERVTERAREVRAELRERRERLRRRIREVLGRIEQAIPEAPRTDIEVRTRGRTEPTTIDAFMTDVLRNIDSYWTRTLRENDLPAPRVGFEAIPPGRPAVSGCGLSAGSTAAFYCPRDDTIYVGQQFAADLYEGVASGLPGESAGYGRAAGDFAVAYVLAHEYAHNVQQELGVFNSVRGPEARPFELQADCLAGAWANSAYEQGLLKSGDLDEILNTALAVGDFEVGTEQHHGKPEERRAAVLEGFRSGNPGACDRYVPAV